jgi:hypothetical protein
MLDELSAETAEPLPPTFEDYLESMSEVITDGQIEVDFNPHDRVDEPLPDPVDEAVAQESKVFSFSEYVASQPSPNGNGHHDAEREAIAESWRSRYENPESLSDLYSGDEPRLQPIAIEGSGAILCASFNRLNVLALVDHLLSLLLPLSLHGLTGKALDEALIQALTSGELTRSAYQVFVEARTVMFVAFAQDIADNIMDVVGVTMETARHRADTFLVKGTSLEDATVRQNRKSLHERWRKMGDRIFKRAGIRG